MEKDSDIFECRTTQVVDSLSPRGICLGARSAVNVWLVGEQQRQE